VVFLGHIVSKKGIKVDLKKLKAITECPRLTNVIEIKNFSGLAVREGFINIKDRLSQLIC